MRSGGGWSGFGKFVLLMARDVRVVASEVYLVIAMRCVIEVLFDHTLLDIETLFVRN
jgi:hypothetical protein